MLLQLLVDDNANVRFDASEIICRLEPCNKLECFESTLLIFFEKFKEIVAVKYPEIAVSALFCWSVSLLGDMNYEMDDNEVSEIYIHIYIYIYIYICARYKRYTYMYSIVYISIKHLHKLI